MKFIELNITSNFTFLKGGSHPEEYANRAAEIGMEAFAIADENSVSGIVRAHKACLDIKYIFKESKISQKKIHNTPRLIPAAKLILKNNIIITILAQNRVGWGNLSRLISKGRLSAPKGGCVLDTDDVLEFGENLILLIHPTNEAQKIKSSPNIWKLEVGKILKVLRKKTFFLMSPVYDGNDRKRFTHFSKIAKHLNILTVASGSPLMHSGSRRRLTDILTCIRENL
ncbi:MAG: PHP domain-containing protein, partial [Proteobacteria bacterium]|nr:PHP domain-containing protein [Pseudomonadota bacterium]